MVIGPYRPALKMGVLAIALTVLGALAFWPDTPQAQAETLLRQVLASARPTQGRLSGFDHSPLPSTTDADSEIASAQTKIQLLILGLDRGPASGRLNAYLDVARQDWKSAAEEFETLDAIFPGDAQLANDLGVVYLELAHEDRTYLVRAFTQFTEAGSIDPVAPEPWFNLVRTYRRLHLDQPAEESLNTYRELESNPEWISELDVGTREPAADVSGTNESNLLWDGSDGDLDRWWQALLQTGLYSDTPFDPTQSNRPRFDRYETEHDDRTPFAIFAALESPARETVITLRKEVERGRAFYEQARFEESVRIIENALAEFPAEDPNAFDRSWAELNLAEALGWISDGAEALTTIERIIESARRDNQQWLLASALTVFARNPLWIGTRAESIGRLEEAVRIFERIGFVQGSVAARTLLTSQLVIEGSSDRAFNITLDAMSSVGVENHRRRYQISRNAAANPLVTGTSLELAYLKSALESAERSEVHILHLDALLAVANAYDKSDDGELALEWLNIAEEQVGQAETDLGPLGIEYSLFLTRARVLRRRGMTNEAIAALQEGLEALDQNSIGIFFNQQYRMELAQAYLQMTDVDSAAREFKNAVEAVEIEDDGLPTVSRLTFDELRRRIYEAAIIFEIDRGNSDRAWTYLHQYRDKLFAELVRSYVPAAETARTPSDSSAGDAGTVENHTVVEYMLLEDQTVIGVIAPDGTRTVESVPVGRDELGAEAHRLLLLLQSAGDQAELNRISTQLHEWLIAPVAHLLRPGTSLIVIPDRILNRIPFQALLSEEGRYLVEDFPVTLTPSLSYFRTTTAPSEEAPRLVSIGSQDSGLALQQELRGVADIYTSAESIDGFDVTPSVFLDGLSNASLLHYAGYSAVDGINALTSAINFDESGDNTVTAVEIASRRMDANALVVLSSCESSVGNSIGGVGFRGLTSAFLVAGAGSVVGSLWEVESSATTDLMLEFHRNVARGMPIASALRDAQLVQMREQPHPYYWSAFNITGNRSALERAPFVEATSAIAAVQ